MKKSTAAKILSVVLTAALAIGAALLPGTDAAAKTTKTSTTTTSSGYKLTVPAALITGNQVTVTVTGTVQATDDGLYHLYAQDPYMSGVQGTEVAQAAAAATQTFTFALNSNTANSMLYKKFVVVGVVGGQLTQLSNAEYITNPEVIATHTQARAAIGKKGLLPAAQWIQDTSRLKAMGVQQISYNMYLSRLITGGGISYTYNGKTYSFNASVVGEYDSFIPKMTAAGIRVNMIIVCDANCAALFHPLSTNAAANDYMMNTTTADACNELAAIATFLAERYSGTGHGTIDNWIIGNEVNARQEWNYMDASVGLTGFTKAYADEFRIFYNGIKSVNANADVLVATDHEWKTDNAALHYGGKEFLDTFNTLVKAEGNIDWSLATHPYNAPLYAPNVLTGNVRTTHDASTTSYITMENIEVLTDYLCQSDFLNPAGQVRDIVLSEVGYTSLASMGSSDAIQAADVVFAISQANVNQYIDGIIINRQLTDVGEVAQGLDYGLSDASGNPKQAYSWYTTAEDPNTIAAASAVLGTDITAFLQVR